MSIFDFQNFKRQGNTKNDVQLNSNDEVRESVINLSTNTLRTIEIFTPDLEHVIYNNNEFRENLLNFTRGNRHAHIKILADDLTYALHNGHRLIQLAQQLPSIVTIKKTPEDYQNTNVSFILFDQTRFIFKADKSVKDAISSDCKYRVNKLQKLFITVWDQAEQDINTRRFTI